MVNTRTISVLALVLGLSLVGASSCQQHSMGGCKMVSSDVDSARAVGCWSPSQEGTQPSFCSDVGSTHAYVAPDVKDESLILQDDDMKGCCGDVCPAMDDEVKDESAILSDEERMCGCCGEECPTDADVVDRD